MKDEHENAGLLHLGLILLLGVCGFIIYLTYKDSSSDQEISNNITLIIEILVGIAITIILSWTAKLNEIKLNLKINEMREILKQSERDRIKKEIQIKRSVLLSLQNIKNTVAQILSEYSTHDGYKKSSEENSQNKILSLHHVLEKLSKTKLDDPINMPAEFFSKNTMKHIRDISSLCKYKPNFSTRNPVANASFYNDMQNMLSKILEDLYSDFPDYPVGHKFSVSTDRVIYPLGSKIYVQANMAYAIKGNPIVFEIFNKKQKLLDTKTIFAGSDHLTHPDSGIYEIVFKMDGDDWNVKESYTVRATYGNTFEEKSFAIVQRTPIIQTDKSVYAVESDVIVTVVDLNSNKDNEAIEYVGDRKDSRLTIKSKYGKIDKYRLKETGNSTGIFQGVIGILGVQSDGTTIPYNTGAKIIEKTQGKEGEDGYIESSSGDEIIFTYQYGSKTVSVSCFVSEFSVFIKLDKKTYKPNDKIQITIIDPDHEHGMHIDNEGKKMITVNIKIGTNILNDYKLFEDPDGVFVGELFLKKYTGDQSSSKTEDGSPSGILCCRDGDSIEVNYTSFLGNSSTARAFIQT